ncbi:MAG: hypothetical protein C0404_07435 [Verrucomicrobia bacterium]|nr:hypothetical protein [Verrucomicrobiota bacterium]
MISLKLDRLSSRERIGLALAVVAVSAVLMQWLVIRPVLSVIEDADERMGEARARLRENLSYLQIERSVRVAYQASKDMLGQTSSDDRSTDELKSDVDELARRHHLDVPSMENRELKRVPNDTTYFATEYAVDISKFEADLKDLLAFLQSVQDAPGMLRVTKLVVSPGRSNTRLKGSMQLTKIMLHPSSK